MAVVTRVNGLGPVHGTQYNTTSMGGFEIDAIVNLAAEGGIGKAIEIIVNELSPVMYVSTGTAGKIFMVIDTVNNDAASLQVRLQNLGTTVGPNDIDLSASTVTARDLDGFVATT
jgi:hypothetical protein